MGSSLVSGLPLRLVRALALILVVTDVSCHHSFPLQQEYPLTPYSPRHQQSFFRQRPGMSQLFTPQQKQFRPLVQKILQAVENRVPTSAEQDADQEHTLNHILTHIERSSRENALRHRKGQVFAKKLRENQKKFAQQRRFAKRYKVYRH